MKRRWLFLFAVFVAAVLGAGYLLIPVGEGITQANCDKIQKGWSEKECEELVGKYTTGFKGGGMLYGDPRFSAYKVWSNYDGDRISVVFDKGGVIEKHFTPGDLSLVERIKRRIQRRLPAWWW
jgi:hypothetical protein